MDISPVLKRLGVPALSGPHAVISPVDGRTLASLSFQNAADMAAAIGRAQGAFAIWRDVPAPRRGELVRILGDVLRGAKDDLATLVTAEAGKIRSEALGEVQEMIDICDFAVGLSRQLYGLTMPSERPRHHMRELWHPLGVVGVITAFNFPVAVWAWNAALALVCGDTVVWKPSEKTPLTALATQAIFDKAVARFRAEGGVAPDHLSSVVIGGRDTGEALANDARVPLVSATGSTRMGADVAARVSARLGRHLLELGGNNAMIVTPSADLDMTRRAALFSAVGTAGQRCTTLRRLIVHRDVKDTLLASLVSSYRSLAMGDPNDAKTLVGPLIDAAAVASFKDAVARAQAQGGVVHAGGDVAAVGTGLQGGFYVQPTIIGMPAQTDVVRHETFAPILYVMTYDDFDQAIALNNDVPQGLSSCCFTMNIREAELFLSACGSDCGIANVNIGPSGAEIGGAFGGEKDTGGGRESGSDSWKAYMRRQTQTVNYSDALPLAQGVVFSD